MRISSWKPFFSELSGKCSTFFKSGLILIVTWFATIAQAANETLSILVVNQGGYRPIYVDYLYGLRPILTTNLSKQVVIYRQSLDFSRSDQNDYQENLTGWLNAKYQNTKLDAIVASGQESIDFVLKARPNLWPRVPVIAVGSEDAITNALAGQTNVTGFIIDIDVQGTLGTAVRLFPDTRRIAFVSPGEAGENDALEYYRHDLQQVEDFCSNRFQLIKLVGLTMAGTKQRLAQLPPHTIVFYDGIRTDVSDVILRPGNTLEALSSVSTAPIFSYSRFYVGYGMVGGMCINPSILDAKLAGQIAAVVRVGNASSVPVTSDQSSHFVFDWRQLQKYGLNTTRLPPQSEGLFRPPTLWEAYHTIIIIVAAALAVQTALILALLWQRRRMLKTEDEFSSSQRMLRTVLDTIPQHILWKDRHGFILGCNRAVIKECGNIVGKTDFETGAAKHAEKYRADDLEVMEKNQSKLNFLEPQTRTDGSQGWYRSSKVPLHDKDGRVIGILGTYDDITELKRAEENLREKTALLEAQLNSTIEGILVVDNQGKKVLQNQKTIDLWKIPQNIVTENDDAKQVHFVTNAAKNPEQFVEKVSYLYAHPNEISRDEIELKDGTVLDRYSSPVIGKDGKHYGRIWSFRDITEQKRAEEALRESERRLRTLAEASFEGICISENGRILDANDQFIAIFGCERNELIGREILELIAPKWRSDIAERVHSGEGKPIEHQCLRKDGSVFECEAQARTISLGGREVRVSAVRDLTERKQLEAQLRQAQKMEAFGQLAAGVAHDFNNLLTVIQGNVTLLQIQELAPAERTASLTEIATAAGRAANLTRQLLTFSRRQIFQPRPLDLNEVVADTIKMLQRLIGEHISLKTDFVPGGAPVMADRNMIEQVLVNLAVNSRDAMPNGGQLAIQTAGVAINKSNLPPNPKAKTGSFIRLSVSDNGCGVPPEQISRLFEPFFTTKEVGKGTGLGLATVFGIIAQHNGWIDVKSQVNSGATFQIYFPRFEKQLPNRVELPKPSNIRGGTETILLVEDEAPVRSLTKMALERQGYRIIEADSGVSAAELWQQHRDKIDLLFTDMVMPGGLSGRELSERLRAEKPSLKVIYVSGYNDDMLGENSPLRNNPNFLEKPFDTRKLLTRIRECLDAR